LKNSQEKDSSVLIQCISCARIDQMSIEQCRYRSVIVETTVTLILKSPNRWLTKTNKWFY